MINCIHHQNKNIFLKSHKTHRVIHFIKVVYLALDFVWQIHYYALKVRNLV